MNVFPSRSAFPASELRIAFLLAILFLACGLNIFAQDPPDLGEFSYKIANGSVEEKRDALYQLRNFATREASIVAIPALIDASEIVRATAASAVIYIGKNESAELLIPLLKDSSGFVRREAAYALGSLGAIASTKSLVNVLQNDNKRDVRIAAAIALGKIGDLSAVDSLTETISKNPKSSHTFVRRSAALAIGQIARMAQFQESIEPGADEVYDAASFEAKKQKYINLTKHLEFARANEVLIKMLQNKKESSDAKREAAFALGEIADSGSLKILSRFIDSEDEYLSEIAAESTIKILNSNLATTINNK